MRKFFDSAGGEPAPPHLPVHVAYCAELLRSTLTTTALRDVCEVMAGCFYVCLLILLALEEAIQIGAKSLTL